MSGCHWTNLTCYASILIWQYLLGNDTVLRYRFNVVGLESAIYSSVLIVDTV